MRVAVLCPGPATLHDVWSEELFPEFECVVAVNTSGRRFAHHWLAGFDRHIFDPVLNRAERQPLIGVITNRVFGERAVRNGLKWVRPTTYYGGAFTPLEMARLKEDKCPFTMPAALQFALTLSSGPGIEIFGMDYTDDKYDSEGQKGCHKPRRWQREASFLRLLWKPGIVVHGAIDPGILAFIRSERAEYP